MRILVLVLLGVLCCPGGAMAARLPTTWYGSAYGFVDRQDNNQPAFGIPNNIPGIARPQRRTARGYYLVEDPKGKKILTVHSDFGPSTGKLDVNAATAHFLGYGPNSFPSNARFNFTYLGQNQAQARRRAEAAGAIIPPFKVFGGGGALIKATSKGPNVPQRLVQPLLSAALHRAIAHGGLGPEVGGGLRYGNVSPQAQQQWTPEYKQWFAAHGGEQGFRQRESLRGMAKKAPDFHDQSQPQAPPREPSGAFNPMASAITPGAPGVTPRPIDAGVAPMAPNVPSGLAALLKGLKIPGV